MDVERERGISITSAALEFELYDCKVTLLDTPGHKDFPRTRCARCSPSTAW
jgi:peptide chain release factor 3